MTKERLFQINSLLQAQQVLLYKAQVAEQVAGKTILVTGAAGSIGSEIVKQLVAYAPHKILLLDVAEVPLQQVHERLTALAPAIQLIPCLADVKDVSVMHALFAQHQPAIVYHAAANKHVPFLEGFPYQAIQNNVVGTKIIADLALAFQVATFVFISTDKAVNPSSIMGASKRLAELYIQALNHEPVQTNFIITRFGNVFGSSGSVGPLFNQQIKAGGPVTLTHPAMERYFMTLSQACELVLEAGTMGTAGEMFVFDMGIPIRIIDLAKAMIVAAGFQPESEIKIETIGIRPGEKLKEELITATDVLHSTRHPQIKKVCAENNNNLDEVKINIDSFLSDVKQHAESEIVLQMKVLVPEFTRCE